MTNEERDIITRFIERAGGAAQAGSFSGSVPASTPALPPVDPEANALIKDLFNRYPEAPYRITQLAFVEEQALAQAQNRIRQLEWELQQARQAQQEAQPKRGLFGGLFGGGSSQQQPPPQQPQQPYQQQQYQARPPPPPQYAPGYQPGMFQQGGGTGFLGGALRTAAGVAGGVLAADALMNLFSGHGGGFGGGGFGGGGFGGDTIIEQPRVIEQSPWAGGGDAGGAAANPWDNVQNDSGWDNAGGAAGPADQGGGWDNASDSGGGGFDTGGDFGGGGGDGGFDNT